MSKYTEKYLQENIVKEEISQKNYFYTQVEKARNTLSFTNKSRLLIYSQSESLITYIEEQKPPFKVQKNLPKFLKDKANLMASYIRSDPKNNILEIVYPRVNEKKEKVMGKWEFIMKNKGILSEWVKFLEKQRENNLKGVSNPSLVGNVTAGTLMPKKMEQEKQEEQMESFFLRESKLKEEKKKSQIIGQTKNEQKKPQTKKEETKREEEIKKSQREQQVKKEQIKKSNIIEQEKKEPYIKPQSQRKSGNDWNLRFIKNPTIETISDFQKEALEAYRKIQQKDMDKTSSLRTYEAAGLAILVAQSFTSEGRLLKKQFRNYHYLISCLEVRQYISIPLCCLIENKGSVALVKSQVPPEAEIVNMNSELQSYLKAIEKFTKINSSILLNSSCTIADTTKLYGSVENRSRYFIDGITDYLPQMNVGMDSFAIRSSLMQYHIRSIIVGGNLDQIKQSKTKSQVSSQIEKQITEIVNYLSAEDIYITNVHDLKEYIHEEGVNLKLLPKIFNETKNKFVRKYLQTCLVAKLVKDQVTRSMQISKQEKNDPPLERTVENKIKWLVEGKSINTNEAWKKLAVQFRKKYNFSLNSHELEGGFFLSCLMTLISADYDLKKIYKEKIIFQDQNIIEEGFIRKLTPKVKSYQRLSSNYDKIVDLCKFSDKDQQIYSEIVDSLNLQKQKLPSQLTIKNGRLYVLAYLSQFVSPPKIGSNQIPSSQQIYQYVNYEPPSSPTLKITLNYLMVCVENNNSAEFEKTFKTAQDIINYWLGYEHPQICDFYGTLSDYEWKQGETEESIRVLEKIVKISNETQGKNQKKLGIRYHALGDRQLKNGYKKEAMDNLKRAQVCFENANEKFVQYPITLMKIASLYLNGGDINLCIDYGNRSLTESEGIPIREYYLLKTYEIMCRAYEINDDKDELRKLSLKCAKAFNNTEKSYVFSEMVKIGLTGTITKLSKDKSKAMLKLALKMDEDGDLRSEEESVKKLMDMAKHMVVMEKFILRSEAVEKLHHDIEESRKISSESADYLKILAFVTGDVGLDFLEGLVNQKEYE